MISHYKTYMASTYRKNIWLRVMKLITLVYLFGHQYHILSLSNLWVYKTILEEYMTYMVTPLKKNPCHGSHEIYNSGRPISGYHFYIRSLCDQYPRYLKKQSFFLYDFHGHVPSIEFLPVGHEINNFCRSALRHHYFILSLSNLGLKYINFYIFPRKSSFPGVIFNFCRLTMCIFNFDI